MLRGDRKTHGKLAALTGTGTVRLNAAPVHFDQTPYHRQSNPESSLRAVRQIVHLVKQLEDVGKHLGRYADACIAHTHDDLFSLALGGEPNASASIRILGGVIQKV